MKILDWPEAERPRERLMKFGAGVLSDAELLALFVGQGLPGCNAVELARGWLVESQSLRGLLEQDRSGFKTLPGAGDARYVLLQAALELGRRYLGEALAERSALTNPDDVRRYLQTQLSGETREHFGVLFLDAQHKVICWRVLFSGTINSASVYPRVIAQQALELNAVAVILAHNHPSGVSEPSLADQQITEQITDALTLIDVKVLDHLIVAGNSSMSFAERGLL